MSVGYIDKYEGTLEDAIRMEEDRVYKEILSRLNGDIKPSFGNGNHVPLPMHPNYATQAIRGMIDGYIKSRKMVMDDFVTGIKDIGITESILIHGDSAIAAENNVGLIQDRLSLSPPHMQNNIKDWAKGCLMWLKSLIADVDRLDAEIDNKEADYDRQGLFFAIDVARYGGLVDLREDFLKNLRHELVFGHDSVVSWIKHNY